jgi:hypothetical protein
MATADVHDLKARCKALGYELVIGDNGQQFMLGGPHGTEAIFIHRSDEDDDLAGWIESREAEKYGPQLATVNQWFSDGTYSPPSELRPALDLFKRLVAEGESISVKAITHYLRACGRTVGGDGDDDASYAVMMPNQSRRGLSFAYAEAKLYHQLTGVEPVGTAKENLHEQTVVEIRKEHPDADEREIKLRVALRESIGMTRDEEDATYERISKALS